MTTTLPAPTSAAVLVRRPGPRPRALTGVSGRVAEGASLLLRDHALAPLPSGRAWQVVSEDGERLYLTSPGGCTCAAGLRGVRCKHRVACELATDGSPRAQAARYWRAARRLPAQAPALRELARASAFLARGRAA